MRVFYYIKTKHIPIPVECLTSNMAGRAPLEIGMRGTIGSLVKREIEYFREFDLEFFQSGMDSDKTSYRRSSWPRFSFSIMSWTRKKRRKSVIRPGICSVVEISESQELNQIPGFSYQNLKVHSERFDV